MDVRDKKRLRGNRVRIVKNLEPKDILDYLQEDDILTATDCEMITNGKTRRERSQLLLDTLPRRGPNAYKVFTHALNASKYEYLNEYLSTSKKCESQLGEHCNKKSKHSAKTIDVKKQELQPYIDFIHENIEPNDILDYLYQEQVLSDEECERIKACRTRKSRCSMLIDELSFCSDKNVVTALRNSCKPVYPFIDQVKPEIRAQKHNSVSRGSMISTNEGHRKRHFGYTKPRCSKCGMISSALFCTKNVNKRKRNQYIFQNGVIIKPRVKIKRVVQSFMKTTTNTSVAVSNSTKCSIDRYGKYERIIFTDSESSSNYFNALVPCKLMKKCKMNMGIQKQPQSTSPLEQQGHLLVAFNYLSTLINQGKFDLFQYYSKHLQCAEKADPDLACILQYLCASRELFKANSDAAKSHIQSGLEIATKTSNPQYFQTELLSAKTRMYLARRRLQKFQHTLDEAKMVIKSDPFGCTGHAAGWLYLNEARNYMTQIGFINFHTPSALPVFPSLQKRTKESLYESIDHFQRDVGKDKQFGFGYALCRFVILLLQCGDNGRLMGILRPCQEDIITAGKYVKLLESTEKQMPKILQMHFNLAKCDSFYRQNDILSAEKHAELAHQLGSELEMLEYSLHAYNRLIYLRTQRPLIITDISENNNEADFSTIRES